jgi:hypothetical protein
MRPVAGLTVFDTYRVRERIKKAAAEIQFPRNVRFTIGLAPIFAPVLFYLGSMQHDTRRTASIKK